MFRTKYQKQETPKPATTGDYDAEYYLLDEDLKRQIEAAENEGMTSHGNSGPVD